MPRTESERQQIRDSHKDSWIAVRPGDMIKGELVDVTEAWSDQRRDPNTGQPGSWYPLLVINAAEANDYDVPLELKVHCFGAVLFNEVMRKQPPIGDQVRITYTGVGEAKGNQNPPELYTVRVGAGGQSAKRVYARIMGKQVEALSSTPARPPAQPVQPELAADQAADDIPF